MDRLIDSVEMMVLILYLLCFIGSGSEKLDPSFDVPMVNVTVKEGTTAILPCSVKSLGEHQVVWTDQWSTLLTFEDRRIIDDERLSVERPYTKDWNLHIRAVKHKDEGIYNCQVNTSPVKIKTVNLKVQVPAKIIPDLSSEGMTVREGDTVTLVCNVTGIPMPTVTWYRRKAGDNAMEKERIGVSGEVLIIHNVSRFCGDTYECVAFNGVPPAVSRQIQVAVEFPPEVRLPNRRIGQDRGKETILECIISAYPQEISVWKHNGMQIANSVKYRVEIYIEDNHSITLSLRIRGLEPDDFGEYTCMASNMLGADKETMILYDYSAYRKPSTIPITTTTTVTTPASEFDWRQWQRTRFPPQIVNGRGYTVRTQLNIVTRRPTSTPRPTEKIYLGNRGIGAPSRTLESKNISDHASSSLCTISVILPVIILIHSFLNVML